MNITVSSGRKVYRKASDGSLDSSNDSFQSQTINIPDDSTAEYVREVRLRLQHELDFMVDLHFMAQGLMSVDQVSIRKNNRAALYEKLLKVFAKDVG